MSNDNSTAAVTVRDEPDRHRYTASVDGQDAGFLVYHQAQGRHLFVHVEVDETYEGKGVASTLVREALDDVRSADGSIVPICPYVRSWVDRHEDYRPMVDEELDTLLRP